MKKEVAKISFNKFTIAKINTYHLRAIYGGTSLPTNPGGESGSVRNGIQFHCR